MVFEFKSTCGSAISSTNNAMGSVLMSTQYRASSPPFATKQDMDNEQYSTDVVPWTNACHFIECSPHQSPLTTLYIRSAQVVNDSPEMYDLGTMYLATCGQQAAGVVLGELWCSYQVELLKPQLGVGSSAVDTSILTAHCSCFATNSKPFNAIAFSSSNTLGMQTLTDGTQILINGGQFATGDLFQFTYISAGTTTTLTAPAFSFSGASPYQILNGGSTSGVSIPPNGVASANYTSIIYLKCTGQGSIIITASSGGVFPNSVSTDIIITPINTQTL